MLTGGDQDLAFSAAQLVEACRDLSCTCSAKRVTESDGSSVDVDLLRIELQLLQAVHVHAGKSFIDLPQVNVRGVEPGALKNLAGSRRRISQVG